ncbi:carbon-nitrogen hydrolase family protein [[Actinomadura] parvosata]|uniref:carbon-nitrogen hydrolase family protein n=1 Tax=[Actinomadura] parvosata TaxID=1955412 RepID=UPI00406BF220
MTEHAGGPGVHPLPARPIRIAAAQAQAQAGDIEADTATAAAMIREAAAAGARLVVFPEKFLSGYEPDRIQSDPRRHAVQPDDPRPSPITGACRETGVAAVVGAAFHDQGDLYVSALVIGTHGQFVTRYDKQHLFKSERKVYRAGAAGCTLELDGWRLGLGICYDSGFPEHARAAALDGCHAYVVGALFSVGNGYHESRGRPLAEAGPDQPQLITADLDPRTLHAVRDAEPMLRDLPATTTHPRDRHRLA